MDSVFVLIQMLGSRGQIRRIFLITPTSYEDIQNQVKGRQHRLNKSLNGGLCLLREDWRCRKTVPEQWGLLEGACSCIILATHSPSRGSEEHQGS